MASVVNECLPNLPGYTARMPLEPGDKRHYKKTTLTYFRGYAMDGVPVHADVEPSGFQSNQEPREPQDQLVKATTTPPNNETGPKWVQNDRKVLRWFGYFLEAVPESPYENFRVRRLVICHYLADDSTEIIEPKINNSGLWQGSFLKRHKLPKEDGTFFGPTDFLVGQNVSIYGKVIRIVDADAFTRSVLDSLGQALEGAQDYPADQFAARSRQSPHEQIHVLSDDGKPSGLHRGSSTAYGQLGRLEAYLLNSKKACLSSTGRRACCPGHLPQEARGEGRGDDRPRLQVLRFFCVWDDRQRLFGDRRPFRLHFYLEDHTTELLEVHEQNSGRDKFPVFLSRAQIAKDPEAKEAGRTIDRSLCFGVADFRIGTFLHIYGRDFFVHDCDEFTRKWYLKNMGYTKEMMTAVDVREAVPQGRIGNLLPPYNGYGTLEDSAENCKHLIPKAPKKDFFKLINKSKIVLRFGARLMSTASHKVPEDHSERQFVLSYFMADDSLSIFENPSDGFPGGKFLERSQVPKSGGCLGDIVLDTDLYLGEILIVHTHAFELYSADEYTLQYMENNRHEYKMADWELALASAKDSLQGGGDSLRAALVEVDQGGSGNLAVEALAEVFQLANLPLTKHQVISIHRRLSKSAGKSDVSVGALLQALHLEN